MNANLSDKNFHKTLIECQEKILQKSYTQKGDKQNAQHKSRRLRNQTKRNRL